MARTRLLAVKFIHRFEGRSIDVDGVFTASAIDAKYLISRGFARLNPDDIDVRYQAAPAASDISDAVDTGPRPTTRRRRRSI